MLPSNLDAHAPVFYYMREFFEAATRVSREEGKKNGFSNFSEENNRSFLGNILES